MKSFFVFLVVVVGILSAQDAEQYCATERAEGEACYQQCCENLGYTWSGGGCGVSGSDQDYVSTQCGYCTDAYVSCIDDYEQQLAGGSPSSDGTAGGCCASAILLSVLGIACLSIKR